MVSNKVIADFQKYFQKFPNMEHLGPTYTAELNIDLTSLRSSARYSVTLMTPSCLACESAALVSLGVLMRGAHHKSDVVWCTWGSRLLVG